MGFQDMNEIMQKFASAKGGRRRVKKGLAALPPERRLEIATKGGKTGGKGRGKNNPDQTQDSRGSSRVKLADILGDLDEIHD